MSLRLLLLGAVLSLHAETGHQAWLRYEPLSAPPSLPAVVVAVSASPVFQSARDELIRGVRGMTGRTLRVESGPVQEPAIVLQTGARGLAPEAFTLRAERGNIVGEAAGDRGAPYRGFALLRKVA